MDSTLNGLSLDSDELNRNHNIDPNNYTIIKTVLKESEFGWLPLSR